MNFTIDTTGINDDDIAHGRARATAKVRGYWSRDSITLYLTRSYTWSDEGKGGSNWTVTLSHSSGGRDTDEVKCDMEAAKNFAAAMVAMAGLGESLKTQHERFESLVQARRAAERQKFELAEAAKMALIEADPMLGAQRACDLIDTIMDSDNIVNICVYERGEDRQRFMTVERKAKRVLYWMGRRISRKDAIGVLATKSHRTECRHVKFNAVHGATA